MKLSEFIEKEFQPSEKSKMKNFLRSRASRDQENVHKEPGTYEGKGPLDTSKHPENKNTSQRYNNGYPWALGSLETGGIFENEELDRIHQNLIGREFQTLQDLGKMVSRLQQAGFAHSDIVEFIKNYIV